jgi:HEAT repeat protein
MVIRRSSAREVSALLQDLESGTGGARDAAVARLSVIGTRAVEGLLALLTSSTVTEVRAGTLAALEAIGDPRAADAALDCLEGDDGDVRAAAAAVLRRLLESPRGASVLDRLAAIAVDTTRPDGARLAALESLRHVPGPALDLISARLRDDPSLAVRATVARGGGPAVRPPLEALEQAAAGQLPEHPDPLRQWLAAAGADAPLPTLHSIVQRVRDRERESKDPVRRAEWMTARAVAHQVLAARGSTVALYDLRETIESGEQAPVEMLAAIAAIGDRTCLEPIAAVYARLIAPAERRPARQAAANADWWRQHLAVAFREIVAREKLNERSALTKRLRTRWPQVADALLGPPR